MKQLLTLIALAAVVGIASAAAAQDAKTVQNVNELLGGIESSPTADEWKKLGPDAAMVLRQVASSPKTLATRRARATTALKNFPTDDTKKFLGDLVADEKAPMIVRRRAVLALTVFGNDVLPTLQTYVAHDNKRMRESVVKALGKVKTPEAKTLLQTRLKVESRKYLKEEIQKSIKVIDAN